MNSITFSSDIIVKDVASYGGDWLICDAARVSTKGSIGSGPRELSEADKGLIRTLVKGRHGAPFQHGGLTFFVEAPIFVFREWRTHRVYTHQSTDDFSYSEASARYRPMSGKFWLPRPERPMVKVEDFKPMRPEFEVPLEGLYQSVINGMEWAYTRSWLTYQNLLAEGIAPEVARAVLPVGAYSAMYVSTNPRSLSHFLSLRTRDDNAAFTSYPQAEIEEAARAAEALFKAGWPETYKAWHLGGRFSL
jgi:thymidylate synthase (FAD)